MKTTCKDCSETIESNASYTFWDMSLQAFVEPICTKCLDERESMEIENNEQN